MKDEEQAEISEERGADSSSSSQPVGKPRTWLDRLEVDVLVGGAFGVPGVFSGSLMGGATINEADEHTGRRETALSAYVLPGFSVGGYAKLDLSYSRSEGARINGGGGAVFLGIWGGPGGRSWGNIFAGGVGLAQVISLGAGYGTKDGEPYGAVILSTFWPPCSVSALRIDTVVRHPGLAIGAKYVAEMLRKLSESKFVRGGMSTLEGAGAWLATAARPLGSKVTRGWNALFPAPSADDPSVLCAVAAVETKQLPPRRRSTISTLSSRRASVLPRLESQVA